MSECFYVMALRRKSEATKSHFTLVTAGNAHPINDTAKYTPEFDWQKSLVWIPCGVVISCWSYLKFENCCFRLHHPSHFVNVSMMCAVATCYWSLCLLYCSDLWELFIGCGHVGTSLLVIVLSLSRPLICPGSQKSHICYLNSWPETCDFT